MDILTHLIANSIYPLAAFAVSLILTRICIAVLPHLGAHDVKLTMFVAQEYPASIEFFQMLKSNAIYPLEDEKPDEEEPGLGL